MKKVHHEIVSGSVITIVCAILYFFLIPMQIKVKANAELGPEFFPKIIVALTGIIALVYTIIQLKSLKSYNASLKDIKFSMKGYIDHFIFIAMGFVFLLLVEYLGFPITVVLLLIALLFFFGSKGIAKNIIIALLYGVSLWYLFGVILKISFPPGIFGI